MSIGVLFMFGCRPKLQEEINPDAKAKLKMPSNYSPSPQLGGKINPYSMKNIREVKSLFEYLSVAPEEETGEMTQEEREMLHNLAVMPTEESEKKLYVSWQPNGKAQVSNFADALKADSTIQIVPYPIDSTTYKMQNQADDDMNPGQYLENFRNEGKVYAVLTPQQLANFTAQATPQILDTLYFPKQEEAMLEVFAHLITDNIDEQTMITLAAQYPALYQEIHQMLKEGGFQGNKQKFVRRWIGRIVRGAVRIVRHIRSVFSVAISGLSAAFGWGTMPTGSVRVQDDISGKTVPVVNVSVNTIHWGRIVTARTTNNGLYAMGNTRMLFGSIVFLSFENQNARVTAVDIRAEWIVPSLVGAFTLPSAIHVVGFKSARDMSNMQHDFLTHSQPKYWCTILNALHEYRTIAQQRQVMRPEKLLIWAVWANQRLAASAPMFGYIAGDIGDRTSSVSSLLGLKFMPAALVTYLEAFLPDVILTEANQVPNPSLLSVFNPTTGQTTIDPNHFSLTERIKAFAYHEFAHTSHYFKVGTDYWNTFIYHTVSSNLANDTYGSNITSLPGRFCALPEAWAQYMAYQVGMQYYPTHQAWFPDGLNNRVFVNRTLVEHAEINEMFYRDFIPCGLFYDLMDANPNPLVPSRIEPYDNISGYTTKQIFDLMESNVQSMQEYRIRFERTYGANANTQNLFNHYGL